MQIYIHRNNQQLGPFTEAEIRAQLASGAISPQDHVWWQGLPTWMPLAESPLRAPAATAPGMPAIPSVGGNIRPTSNLAIASLVCGCASLFCTIITAIPAIILGHMGLSEIKKHPAMEGRGMALAGLIIGYGYMALFAVALIAGFVLASLGNQVQETFKTITAQINAAQATNSPDQSATNSDQSTNTPTATPTNSPDDSTNSAPASTNSADQSPTATPMTNSADSSTNAPAATTNAPPSQ